MSNFTGLESGKRHSMTRLTTPLAFTEEAEPIMRQSQFFNAADLLAILNSDEDCKGIRFYPIITQEGAFRVVAVGVTANRNELDASDEHIGFVQSQGDSPSIRLSREEFRSQNREAYTYTSYFSQKEIRDILGAEDCIGLRIYQDEWDATPEGAGFSLKYPSLGIVGVSRNMINMTEGPYILSAMPCPPDCTDDPVYAFAKSSEVAIPFEPEPINPEDIEPSDQN